MSMPSQSLTFCVRLSILHETIPAKHAAKILKRAFEKSPLEGGSGGVIASQATNTVQICGLITLQQ